MATTYQPVSFKVDSIERATNKEGYVVVKVNFFNNPEKQYTYVRKAYKAKGFARKSTVIDGCRIYFDGINFDVISVEREYDTDGVKKMSTANQGSGKSSNTWWYAPAAPGKSDFDEAMQAKEEPVVAKTYLFNHVDLENPVKHEKEATIKACLIKDIPVYLAGPAGSGKNYTVEQICEELGWDFYFSNSVQQEYKLTGFIDAGGDFHDTEFYKACTSETDCVFFLDEIDASIPEVLVLLNAAIANGYFEFPTGRVELGHVHFVAAGNTVGSGADETYTGRMVIDQATLDRFVIIEFDYDTNVEMFMAKNDEELVDFIHACRKAAEEAGVRATFSYRCMVMVKKLEDQLSLVEILKIAVFKGLDKDTVNSLFVKTNGANNKYSTALMKMRNAA